jgi:hypothetical protein
LQKGFSQTFGLDYYESFAPVVKLTTLRVLVALASKNNLIIQQMDVDTAFLNGNLENGVYIEPPASVECNNNEILKLNKSFYGLKQAPYDWNKKLVFLLNELEFQQAKSDVCVFYNSKVIVAVYVDVLLIVIAKTWNWVKKGDCVEIQNQRHGWT